MNATNIVIFALGCVALALYLAMSKPDPWYSWWPVEYVELSFVEMNRE